jgi:membrane AbrB-like protein
VAVALVTGGTLAITIGAGVLLARIAPVDPATASLGMVAGGASGIVAMADDLGADDRLVAFMQYLRLAVVVMLTPLIVALVFSAHGGGGSGVSEQLLGRGAGWIETSGIAAVGAVLGSWLRIPAGAFLGPTLLASALTLSGAVPDLTVPPLLRETAFAAIGLYIGLRFERETLRSIRRLLPAVLVSIIALIAGCFLLAWVLELTADVSLLDAYLATTPGGLYAVLPLAFGSGADAGFVLAVQGLRVLVMVLAAPAVVKVLLQPPATSRRRNTR